MGQPLYGVLTGSPERDDKLEEILNECDAGRKMTAREIARESGCSYTAILRRMRERRVRIYGKLVIGFSTKAYKQRRLEFAPHLHGSFQRRILIIIFLDDSIVRCGHENISKRSFYEGKIFRTWSSDRRGIFKLICRRLANLILVRRERTFLSTFELKPHD